MPSTAEASADLEDSDFEHNAALVDPPRALDSADEDRNARPPRPASPRGAG